MKWENWTITVISLNANKLKKTKKASILQKNKIHITNILGMISFLEQNMVGGEVFRA